MVKGLPSLRTRRCYRVIAEAMARGKERMGMRLVHHSVQGNHIHLIVEADDERCLSRGMQGLCIRIARGLNRMLGRRGKVFADRFHSRVLRTPTEIRRALCYVLNNWRKHAAERGRRHPSRRVDVYSSGLWFTGWRTAPRQDHPPWVRPDTTTRALSWLLARGWRRRGLIATGAVPG